MILITTGLKPKTQHVEIIRNKPKKNWFLETVFGFSKKKKIYFFIFLGFSSEGKSLPNRESFKKLDINEELWLNNRFNDAH